MRNIGKLLTIIGVVFGMVVQPLYAGEPEYGRDLLDVAVPLLAVGTITAGIVAAKAFRDLNKADTACKHRTPDGRRHYVDARRFFYKLCAVAGTGLVVTTVAGSRLLNKKVSYRTALARYKAKTADTVMRGKLNAGLRKPVEKDEVVHLLEMAKGSAVPGVVVVTKPKENRGNDAMPLLPHDADDMAMGVRNRSADDLPSHDSDIMHKSMEENSSGPGELSSNAESMSVIRSSAALRKELKSLMEAGKLEELADVLKRVDSESMLEGEILKVLSAPAGGGQEHTILTYVSSQGNAKALEKLLKNRWASQLVNSGDRNEETPLVHAIRSGATECAALLIEAGAPTSVGGVPLLVFVTQSGSPEMLDRLLQDEKVKKTIEDKDKSGRTPLLVAASSGNKDSLDVLLKNHADVRATDGRGYNALHMLASPSSYTSSFRVECAKALLDKGCDARATVGGRTFIDMAFHNGNMDLVHEFCDFSS